MASIAFTESRKAEEHEKVVHLIHEDRMKEAWEYAYENGIEMTEDWEEVNGKEYYVISVEDELFRFEVEE